MHKNQKILIIVIVFLFILSLIPYPTIALNSFNLFLVDEAGKPIKNVSGTLYFHLYPSLKSETKQFVLNENGEVHFEEQNVWMNWFKRRGYNLLSMVSRGGWSSSHSKITLKVPKSNFTAKNIRFAKINQNKYNESISFAPDFKFAITQYEDEDGPMIYINTSIGKGLDTIELNLLKSRKLNIKELKVVFDTKK